MRVSSAGAVFVAFTLVAAAIGVIASRALVPGFARLTSERPQTTIVGMGSVHLPLARGD
ncbi:MAG TPA: hypothetical protein VHX19_04440 [Stellaceae bacterium]|jgi:hypothetical protein|nr:hypothetical protein [Stellaceae bacterium]